MATRQARLSLLLPSLTVLPFDLAAALAYGRIIAQCGWAKGRDFDRMIAAHAIATSSVLVTDNAGDFQDIPGLKTEIWVARASPRGARLREPLHRLPPTRRVR